MTITIDSHDFPAVGARIRDQAEAAGMTVSAYVERLVGIEEEGERELEELALAGLESGTPIEAGDLYWAAKHRELDERLRSAGRL